MGKGFNILLVVDYQSYLTKMQKKEAHPSKLPFSSPVSTFLGLGIEEDAKLSKASANPPK